jgi:hypothetical protein
LATQAATSVVLTETLPANSTFNATGGTAGWTETATGSGVFTLTLGTIAGRASGIVTFAVYAVSTLPAAFPAH